MRICIFCGASSSLDNQVELIAQDVMKHFHQNNTELVYGGASIGVMGQLANHLLSLGGKVVGVIPECLMKREVAHDHLSQLILTKDMHERKQTMYTLSDAFLVFPGGMGTLDELFEITTWNQLGLHSKKIAILNINGYYDHLLGFLDHAVKQGLIRPKDRSIIYSSDNWEDIWNYFNG